MAVLGRNKTLSITDSSKDEFRHSLLKSIARIIPRPERCTSDECEIFSGIFGNAFWHANVSKTLHHWLCKKNVTHLPMSGFPHLRKICNAGYVVDAEGKNTYLIHSERMAVSTLYISGGRSLLVTPKTTVLAYRYMRLHQPGFQHKRVVVEGYGHSDLLIGEESYKNVFPHFICHMRMAEGGGRRKEREEDVISWEAFYDENGGSSGFAFLGRIFWFCISHFICHMRMAEGGGRRKEREEDVISWEAFYDENGGSSGFAFLICLTTIFYFLYHFFWSGNAFFS